MGNIWAMRLLYMLAGLSALALAGCGAGSSKRDQAAIQAPTSRQVLVADNQASARPTDAWSCKGSHCRGEASFYVGQRKRMLHITLPRGWKLRKSEGSIMYIDASCGDRYANTGMGFLGGQGYQEVDAKTSALDLARIFRDNRGGKVGKIRDGGAFGITETQGIAWGAIFTVGPVKRGRRFAAGFWFGNGTYEPSCQVEAQTAQNGLMRSIIKRAYFTPSRKRR